MVGSIWWVCCRSLTRRRRVAERADEQFAVLGYSACKPGTLSLRIRILLDAIRVKSEIESGKGEGEKDKLLEQLLKYLAAD